MRDDDKLVNRLAGLGFLSIADIAKTQQWKPGYVRKLACEKRWQRVRVGNRIYYRMPTDDQILSK